MNLRALKAPAVLAAALMVVVAAGCTDTTVAPKSTVTNANVFKDQNAYEQLIARVYSGLAVSGQQGPAGNPDIQGIDEGFSQYLRLYWELEELPTDEAVIGWNDQGLPPLNTDTWTAQSRMVVAMYYRIFFQVVMANEFLRETSDSALATRPAISGALKAKISQYRAEARFLRALSYWHGIDLFGSIPLVTDSSAIGGAPPAQASRSDLYNYVVSELQAIKDSLPANTPDNYGRATAGADEMLLAELYLNAGVYTGTPDYADALTAAQNVINNYGYTLDPSYRHLFEADNNKSPEIIFPITQDGQNTQTYGGVTFLAHAACGGSMNAGDYGIDYCWGGTRLKQQAYNLYAPNDPRASYFYTTGQTVDVGTIGDFTSGVAAPKFINMTSGGQPGSNPTFVDTDFPLFRLGEAYLIYAEAELRGGGGDATTALNYINALRVRAYGDSSAVVPADSLTLQFVLNERGRELLWEAHRRTDLIRFGMFSGGSYNWAWKGGVAAGTSISACRDIFPLPASEIVANPNLKQNAGACTQ